MIFVDVDTQLDFMFPAGALYVPGAERILPAVARLNRWAAQHGIPVVSTVDAHAEDDPEFRHWPHHSVAGTLGQRKAEATLLEGRITIPNRECDLAIEGARQIVVEKQTVDVFQAVNLARVVERLGAEPLAGQHAAYGGPALFKESATRSSRVAEERCVVYGVVTEICVLSAVRGLLQMGRRVTVVTDAVETLRREDGERALAEACAAGASLATVAELTA